MKYETARKLKKGDFDHPFCGNLNSKHCDKSCFPTLGDLVRLCGIKFESLTQLSHKDAKYKWTGCSKDIRTFGNTSHEAIANLWLALNSLTVL